MRWLIKLGLIIAACIALLVILFAIPPAAPQDTLVRGTVAGRIDFRVHSGLITVPVRVNGSRELRMYLDTGMSVPVVVLFHKEAVAELGLKGGRPILLAGSGDQARRPATLTPGATVEAGPLRLTNQGVIVMDDSRETSDWPVDGVIGKSLFDRYLAEIDYEKSTVTFYEPAGAEIGAAAAAIPIDLSAGVPVIEAAVDVAGGKKIPLKFVVDIGHRNALSLNEDSGKGILRPKRTIKGIAGRGIQGVVPAEIGRVRALELGPFSVTDIPTAFIAPGTNAGLSRAAVDGNIGSLVWRRFKVLLDYPAKKMFLAPNADFRKPFPFNMAGLALEQNRDDVYFVRYVIEKTPAFKNGIKVGDKITAINGVDVRKYSYREVLDIFNGAGRRVSLTIERDGERFQKKFRLKRLI